MHELFENFNSEEEFNYSIHISTRYRFILFNNPKCGCSTTKATLNIACMAHEGKDLRYNSMGEVHDRSFNVLCSPQDVGYRRFEGLLQDKSYFKFSFIREPISRLASAYESKLNWDSDARRLLNGALGRPPASPISFSEFVEAISRNPRFRDLDEHWRLQRKQTCHDAVPDQALLLFEDLDLALSFLLQKLFNNRDIPVFDVRKSFSANESASKRRIRRIGQTLVDAISQAYQADVDLYTKVSSIGCQDW